MNSERASDRGLRVFGSGLPRTGTTSLKTALEILGFGPCHHTEVVAQEAYPYSNSQHWRECCLTEDRAKRRKILRALYESPHGAATGGFQSGCDYPTAFFVDDLIDMYPDAKVVHTVRPTAAQWRSSVNATIALVHSRTLYYTCFLFPPFLRQSLSPLLSAGQVLERRRFDGNDTFEPADSVEIYHRHNDWVRSIVPKDRILEFDVSEGWEPLCRFLEVEVPRAQNGEVRPFPRTNDKASYRILVRTLTVVGLVSWVSLLGSVGVLTWYLLS